MAGDGVIDVPLFLHGAAEVAGVQVEVRFDSAQVEVTGVRTGALFTGDWEVQSNLRAPRRLVVLAHCGLNGTPVRGGDAGVRAWVQVRTVERARAPVSRALAGNAKAVTGGGGDCVGGAGERGVDGGHDAVVWWVAFVGAAVGVGDGGVGGPVWTARLPLRFGFRPRARDLWLNGDAVCAQPGGGVGAHVLGVCCAIDGPDGRRPAARVGGGWRHPAATGLELGRLAASRCGGPMVRLPGVGRRAAGGVVARHRQPRRPMPVALAARVDGVRRRMDRRRHAHFVGRAVGVGVGGLHGGGAGCGGQWWRPPVGSRARSDTCALRSPIRAANVRERS